MACERTRLNLPTTTTTSITVLANICTLSAKEDIARVICQVGSRKFKEKGRGQFNIDDDRLSG